MPEEKPRDSTSSCSHETFPRIHRRRAVPGWRECHELDNLLDDRGKPATTPLLPVRLRWLCGWLRPCRMDDALLLGRPPGRYGQRILGTSLGLIPSERRLRSRRGCSTHHGRWGEERHPRDPQRRGHLLHLWLGRDRSLEHARRLALPERPHRHDARGSLGQSRDLGGWSPGLGGEPDHLSADTGSDWNRLARALPDGIRLRLAEADRAQLLSLVVLGRYGVRPLLLCESGLGRRGQRLGYGQHLVRGVHLSVGAILPAEPELDKVEGPADIRHRRARGEISRPPSDVLRAVTSGLGR